MSYGGRGDCYGGSWNLGGAIGTPGARLREVDWSRVKLESIVKDHYKERSIVTNRSKSEVDAWIQTNQVTLAGSSIPRPVWQFDEPGFPQQIEAVLKKNYQTPTVIQSISWPVALSGRDIISIARTGSGKTLGFLLPGIVHTLAQGRRPSGGGPTVLVMLPTRELAQQVATMARDYCAATGLSYTCLYGGAPKGGQGRELRNGVDVCIATPGRLLDFLEAGETNMQRCSYLVLDEADRMLDMGFEPQIRKIASQIRKDRQTLMFSATWPKEVRELAADFQVNPVFLNVGSMEISANHNITQVVEVIEEHQKPTRLYKLLTDVFTESKERKVLIFTETKRKADDLTYQMRTAGWPALCIHGNKEQREREWVLSEFKQGKQPIMLATDVAARGLDVDDITLVINYDYPNSSEDYVHRIGRTGRRDKKGSAHTFFTVNNAPKARDLLKVLTEANQHVPQELVNLDYTSGGSNSNSRSRFRPRPAGGCKASYGSSYGSGSNAAGYNRF